MTDNADDGRERLVDDVAAVLAEAEEMLKRATQETGDKARHAPDDSSLRGDHCSVALMTSD